MILRKKQYKEGLETKDKKIVEQQKKEMLVKAGEKSILEEYKKELPQKLKTRLNKIAEQLSIREEVQGLSTIEINEILRPHNLIGQPLKYTAEELNIVFEYYRQAIVAINKKVKYPPSKGSFCAFANISTATYNNYLMSPDESMQETIIKINDYLTDTTLTSAQLKEIDNITTMFRSKAEFGLVEAQSPVVIEHRSETDMNKISAMIQQLKQGKSLKTIELKEREDGSWKAEEE